MLRPRLAVPRLVGSTRHEARLAALDTLELHLPRVGARVGARHEGAPPLDLVLSRTTPRTGHGRPYLDIGLLRGEGSAITARSVRHDAGARDGSLTPPLDGAWKAHWVDIALDIVLSPIAHRGGVTWALASGRLDAFGDELILDQRPIFLSERRAARRPYAWARATLYGELAGLPIVCVIETGRRRAGSVVLPELGRVRIFGPGAAGLPRNCVMTALPLRAEYGTGRLRAAALSPTHKLTIELAAPPDETALFEMVDPDGEAAYAHRAGDAEAKLVVTRRKNEVATVDLRGRFEWGARAGDPRVAHRAWQS